jgi:hypothetical protein
VRLLLGGHVNADIIVVLRRARDIRTRLKSGAASSFNDAGRHRRLFLDDVRRGDGSTTTTSGRTVTATASFSSSARAPSRMP